VELAVRAIKQGAYDFLTKPFSVDDLLLAVNQGCERRRLSLDARRTQEAEAEARRLAEEKSRLEELDQAKRKLIRLMTHELQTPVSAILSYLKVIRDGYAPPEKFAEIIEKCIVRAEEERAMIADLLELGRLEIIETRAETELVQLDKVLQDAVDTFQEQAAQKILHFVMDVAPDIPPVVGSPNQFKSLWENLISNAIKYTPKNGTVTLRLHAKDNRVIGEVEDTGIGILPEDRERIFSEFFRARNARESDVYGTGLGLTIVKRIVKNTGGTIDVHSEPGVGSKFTFVIPVANTI
jgi:signal transduction histidine kinase